MKDDDFLHVAAFSGFLDSGINETFALLADPLITVEHRCATFDNNQDLLAARRILDVYLSLAKSRGFL